MLSNKAFSSLSEGRTSLVEREAIQTSAAASLEYRVNMAEMKVENKPVELTTCVGSCVAICVYDSTNGNGGLAHIMLPKADVFPKEHLPAKFADTAVPALVKALERRGSNCVFSAKIAGGANMFPNVKAQDMAIGTKNIAATKAALLLNNIPLTGEDVGGTKGRKVIFNTATGTVSVRLFDGGIKKI